jgi:hypothetical protein
MISPRCTPNDRASAAAPHDVAERRRLQALVGLLARQRYPKGEILTIAES